MARTRLATTLREGRIRATLTQKELAAVIGVHHQTIWYWENDNRSPAPKQLKRLADTLGLDWDHVLELRATAERSRHVNEARQRRAAAQRAKRKLRQNLNTVAATVAALSFLTG